MLQGDPSYRYVLSADRNGGRQLLKTTGTPLSVRFDLTGQTVAVVTGASKAYLLSPALEVRWSGATASLPVRWAEQTGDARSEGGTIFARGDVDALFGALKWIRGAIRQRLRRRPVAGCLWAILGAGTARLNSGGRTRAATGDGYGRDGGASRAG